MNAIDKLREETKEGKEMNPDKFRTKLNDFEDYLKNKISEHENDPKLLKGDADTLTLLEDHLA